MVAQNWDRERLMRDQIGLLADEFRGVHGLETIAQCVHESLDSLEGARIKDYVPILVHRFARERLRALAQEKVS